MRLTTTLVAFPVLLSLANAAAIPHLLERDSLIGSTLLPSNEKTLHSTDAGRPSARFERRLDRRGWKSKRADAANGNAAPAEQVTQQVQQAPAPAPAPASAPASAPAQAQAPEPAPVPEPPAPVPEPPPGPEPVPPPASALAQAQEPGPAPVPEPPAPEPALPPASAPAPALIPATDPAPAPGLAPAAAANPENQAQASPNQGNAEAVSTSPDANQVQTSSDPSQGEATSKSATEAAAEVAKEAAKKAKEAADAAVAKEAAEKAKEAADAAVAKEAAEKAKEAAEASAAKETAEAVVAKEPAEKAKATTDQTLPEPQDSAAAIQTNPEGNGSAASAAPEGNQVQPPSTPQDDAMAKAKAEADARAKAEADARAKAEADARAKAEAETMAEAAYKAKVPAKSDAVTLLFNKGLTDILSDLAKLLTNQIKPSFKTTSSLGALNMLKGQENKTIRGFVDDFLINNATVQFSANLDSEISVVLLNHIGPNGKIDVQGMITDITAIVEAHSKKMMEYIDSNIKSYVQKHLHPPSATESLLGSSAPQGSAGLNIEVYVSAMVQTFVTDQRSDLDRALAQ